MKSLKINNTSGTYMRKYDPCFLKVKKVLELSELQTSPRKFSYGLDFKVVLKPSSPVFFTIAQARPGHTAE